MTELTDMQILWVSAAAGFVGAVIGAIVEGWR